MSATYRDFIALPCRHMHVFRVEGEVLSLPNKCDVDGARVYSWVQPTVAEYIALGEASDKAEAN